MQRNTASRGCPSNGFMFMFMILLRVCVCVCVCVYVCQIIRSMRYLYSIHVKYESLHVQHLPVDVGWTKFIYLYPHFCYILKCVFLLDSDF